ncbi:hypothetical protein LTR56_001542 [Elasticomyces elasticus]|nr:hypothetical protein LTR56_001542 [Elasticomyces elasticus]KAK3668535.1 hypothetical protein LTR22_000422 [Elasticomyces elasticus]KAK4931887.1 hypothetical protein LTR49_001574 [Elasticomyces elasticus]KAK5768581.1 hypothetical protein LTS12_001369 [Elasticomyces elasticus]
MPKTADSNKGKPQPHTVIRRPQAVDTFYSSKTTPEAWQELERGATSCSRQRELSHIGRIEETESGDAVEEKCEQCVQKELQCKVYTEAGRERFHVKRLGYRCSRYRWHGGGCSHKRDADAALGGVKRRTMADADAEIAVLKGEKSELEEAVVELRTSLALYQEQGGGFDGFGSDGSVEAADEEVIVVSRPKSTISYTSR